MSLVAVLNSQAEVKSLIDRALARDNQENFLLHTAVNVDEALEVLSFDLPEIVLWNATDPELEIGPLLESVQTDSWMHNFGIIAIFDRKKASETQISDRLKSINVLTVIALESIEDNLYKHLRIIDANRQILIQLELGDALSSKITGSFNIDNDPLAVPVYAGLAAQALVQRGYLLTTRKRDLQIALTELVQNGIEHGHCGLTSEEKMAFLSGGGSIAELIKQKCDADPSLAAKKVTLEWEINNERTKFFIRDQGEGFDVVAYQQRLKSHKKDQLSGRGIRLAHTIGGKISYNRKGNVACLTIEHSTVGDRQTPKGFEGEQVLVAKKGDVVFHQGEMSDHLFYITSGQFGVYHDGVPIGLLTPADVFMGEMSFLMNNIRTATVICETPGRIIKISRRSFVNTLRKFPQYGLFLAKLMARKLTTGNQERARAILEDLTT